MLSRFPLAAAAALTVATLAAAAPPRGPATTDVDTVSSAVVDDRGPEDLPVRKPATKASPADTPNPLRQTPSADGAAAAPKAAADATPRTKDGAPEATQAGCGKAGCTACEPKVPVCKPKWEDKKTKRPVFSMKCEWECVRPWEPYCQGACCEEKTTPCAGVYTKKRLYKSDEERCERVLKYELEMKPAGACCEAAPVRDCMGCRILGETVHHLLSRCHH